MRYKGRRYYFSNNYNTYPKHIDGQLDKRTLPNDALQLFLIYLTVISANKLFKRSVILFKSV